MNFKKLNEMILQDNIKGTIVQIVACSAGMRIVIQIFIRQI